MLKRFLGRVPTKLPTVEEWAQQHANKASPDGMIAAVIVESLAKNWEDWKAQGLEIQTRYYNSDVIVRPKLTNKKKGIVVEFGTRKYKSRSDGTPDKTGSYLGYDWQSQGTKVNGVEIELKAARHIVANYERLAKVHKIASETAARVEADMKKNEAKWNLAEQLLGLKRDEKGALVPMKEATA